MSFPQQNSKMPLTFDSWKPQNIQIHSWYFSEESILIRIHSSFSKHPVPAEKLGLKNSFSYWLSHSVFVVILIFSKIKTECILAKLNRWSHESVMLFTWLSCAVVWPFLFLLQKHSTLYSDNTKTDILLNARKGFR